MNNHDMILNNILTREEILSKNFELRKKYFIAKSFADSGNYSGFVNYIKNINEDDSFHFFGLGYIDYLDCIDSFFKYTFMALQNNVRNMDTIAKSHARNLRISRNDNKKEPDPEFNVENEYMQLFHEITKTEEALMILELVPENVLKICDLVLHKRLEASKEYKKALAHWQVVFSHKRTELEILRAN